MKIKIRVIAKKTVVIDSDKWDEICAEDNLKLPLTVFSLQQYAKGCLIEDLRNNPNRGSYSIDIEE